MFSLFTLGGGNLENALKTLGVSVYSHYYPRGKRTKEETEALVSSFSAHKPDLFYFKKEDHMPRSLFIRLNSVSKKTRFIMWYGDQRGYIVPPLVKDRIGLIDCLLINNCDKKQFSTYKAAGINNIFTFYDAVSETDFYPRASSIVPITHDVIFGGNNFKNNRFPLSEVRFRLINKIHEKFNLAVYGEGWPFETYTPKAGYEYSRIISSGKVNIGINHYDITGYLDKRFVECVGTGRLHITYYIPGLEKQFKNHEHLVWFKTIQEGLDQISYYLNNDAKRESIAKNGRNFLLKSFSWEARAKQFINIMEKLW